MTTEFLNEAIKSVLVSGPKMRVAKANDVFVELVDASGYTVAVMSFAKG
jgi:pyruvate decarboxylase